MQKGLGNQQTFLDSAVMASGFVCSQYQTVKSMCRAWRNNCVGQIVSTMAFSALWQPWLETKWTGTGRYTGSFMQSIMAALAQPKASDKQNRLRLHNSNSESKTYCFILSFWGPNLGPVGPRLENTYLRRCSLILKIIFRYNCFELF